MCPIYLEEVARVPLMVCGYGAQMQGAVPLADLPVWTLEDDNRGLDAFLGEQVCTIPQP